MRSAAQTPVGGPRYKDGLRDTKTLTQVSIGAPSIGIMS
jgi:hypothetical protein